MKPESKKVHGLDFMFAMACYIQSSSLLSSFFLSITRQDSWIIVLFALIFCVPLVWVYSRLIESFPSKNLFGILQTVYGKYLGKFFSALYVLFFLILTSLNLSDLSEFVKATIMPKTPLVVLAFTFLLTSAWAVYVGGLRQMVKYGFMMTMICILIVIATILLTLNLMEFDNFLPMMDLKPQKYIQATNIVVTIPFAEIIIFLMTTNHVDAGKRGFFPLLLGGVIIGCITILLVIMRDIAVLGNTISLFALPSFETLRMVSVTQALSRMEIVFAFILIALLFFKITWLYYITTLSAAQLLRFQDHRRLILLIGALAVTTGFILYPNALAHNESGQKIVPLVWPIFEIILPLVTLVIAKFRGMTRKRQSGTENRSSSSGAKTDSAPQSGSKSPSDSRAQNSSKSRPNSGAKPSHDSESQSSPKASGSGPYRSQSV
ncbi:GerAB/ArcD/ProY family transporter [Faecalispora anaeroviscerum]|uniref:GerAB/ArcD/ProY family transporter n=1 Tax=Faecalispora anaeroviscerum TaxID=2991836 RepID=UPI0024B95DBF|nr:endospore germination permease [Faecalispora anaeroviscerum]